LANAENTTVAKFPLHSLAIKTLALLLSTWAGTIVAETPIRFKTYQTWTEPRLYYFFQTDLRLKQLIPAGTRAGQGLPLQAVDKNGANCDVTREVQGIRVFSGEGQELLVSEKESWIAARFDAARPFLNFHIEFLFEGSSDFCVMRTNWNGMDPKIRTRVLPILIFAENTPHTHGGRSVTIREDILLSSLRYRVEVGGYLRMLSIPEGRAWAPIMQAKGQLSSHRFGRMSADLELARSLTSFPFSIAGLEWVGRVGPELLLTWKSSTLIIRPVVGMRQLSLLVDETVVLPSSTDTLTHLLGGLDVDYEWGERMLVRGGFEYGFLRLDEGLSATPWRYMNFGASLGYRLRPEMRILLGGGMRSYSQGAEGIALSDVLRANLELDF